MIQTAPNMQEYNFTGSFSENTLGKLFRGLILHGGSTGIVDYTQEFQDKPNNRWRDSVQCKIFLPNGVKEAFERTTGVTITPA